jgi:hypothetical protein
VRLCGAYVCVCMDIDKYVRMYAMYLYLCVCVCACVCVRKKSDSKVTLPKLLKLQVQYYAPCLQTSERQFQLAIVQKVSLNTHCEHEKNMFYGFLYAL